MIPLIGCEKPVWRRLLPPEFTLVGPLPPSPKAPTAQIPIQGSFLALVSAPAPDLLQVKFFNEFIITFIKII